MTDLPVNATWLTDVEGARIGVQIVEGGEQPLVKLLLPDHGAEKLIDRAGAARLVEMLQNGVAFSKIVGDSVFELPLNSIPAAERGESPSD